MRRVPTAVTLMAILAGSAGMATVQASCQQFGNQTYCSNGQNFQQFGNPNLRQPRALLAGLRQSDLRFQRNGLSAIRQLDVLPMTASI